MLGVSLQLVSIDIELLPPAKCEPHFATDVLLTDVNYCNCSKNVDVVCIHSSYYLMWLLFYKKKTSIVNYIIPVVSWL